MRVGPGPGPAVLAYSATHSKDDRRKVLDRKIFYAETIFINSTENSEKSMMRPRSGRKPFWILFVI